jgi:hypothetical protein
MKKNHINIRLHFCLTSLISYRLVGDGVDDTGVKELTMLNEACKFPGTTISLVHEDGGIPDSCGGCGLMEPILKETEIE